MSNLIFGRQVNRRDFLKSAASVTFSCSTLGFAQNAVSRAQRKKVLAYVGTYTGAIGAGSNGEGIYLFQMNPSTGELSDRQLAAHSSSPSWIAIHPSKKFLYAANEVSNYQETSGSVSAFAIDQSTGSLTPLNVVSSEGSGPCYLSFDLTGKFVLVANYNGGTVAVLPILDKGELGAASDLHQDIGYLGSTKTGRAPDGSFANSGHDAPHAHMIAPDPEGKFVLATDLGQDRIYTYRFDSSSGKLIPIGGTPFAQFPSGDGPRHFAFHPNGRWLYVIEEEASNIVLCQYDQESGSIVVKETISSLPNGFKGTSYASEILISPNGHFLYAGNRLNDTITAFSIGPDGRLKWIGEASTMGDYPGQCRIDPSGGFLYACNRRSDNITCFKIHRESGMLTFTGQYAAAPSAASITFLG